jgi:hypothetical protein
MKRIAILSVVAFNLLYASDITIAPAPVSVDNIVDIGNESRVDVGYMNYSTDNIDLTGITVGYGNRERSEEKKVIDWSVNYTNLTGSSGIYDIEGYNISFTYLVGKELSNKDSIIYMGPLFTYMEMDFGVPMGTPLSKGNDSWIGTTKYGLQVGIQYKMDTTFGYFAPWFFGAYLAGSSESEDYGNETTSSESDIDPFFTTSFGFDIYFNELGASLSSMYQSDEDGEMISIAYSFKF